MYYSRWKEDVVDLTAAIWRVHVINFNSSQSKAISPAQRRCLLSWLWTAWLANVDGSPQVTEKKEGRTINGIIPEKSICKWNTFQTTSGSWTTSFQRQLPSLQSCQLKVVSWGMSLRRSNSLMTKELCKTMGNPAKLILYILYDYVYVIRWYVYNNCLVLSPHPVAHLLGGARWGCFTIIYM